ncbi:two-component regulator propeller domain-containing protein [Candidatus Poribacteria bacterium]
MQKWLLYLLVILLHISAAAIWAQESRPNRVLSLDGDGDYVEIADSEALNDIGSQVTMEAWVRVSKHTNIWMPIIYKGETNGEYSSYGLWLNNDGSITSASAPSGVGNIYLRTSRDLFTLGKWSHITSVVDGQGKIMKIFVNGTEVARRDFGEGIHISALPLRIGWSHLDSTQISHFAGEMDEVRIWNIACTQKEIQATMHTALSGEEQGLVGYWGSNDLGSPNARKVDDAHLVEAELPKPGELVIPDVISGMVTDESGQSIPDAVVRLELDGEEVQETQTDASGSYWLVISHPLRDLYDLSAISGESGDRQFGIRLPAGGNQRLNFTLREAISIEGTLMMLDDVTPHVAVVVQAVNDGNIVATTLSDEQGKYRFINLRQGEYQVRCYTLDGYIHYGEEKYGKSERQKTRKLESLRVRQGETLKNIDFSFPSFKKGTWRNYSIVDGLAHERVTTIYCAPDGVVWFGTRGGGISRYDGNEFVNFTRKDGLAGNNVRSIHSDSDGIIWFGTNGGVSRYDGKEFVNFTMEDGLAGNLVHSIHCTADGVVWFGTGWWGSPGNGVSRYDGNEFVNFTMEDGLASNGVYAIHSDSDDIIWFGTVGGISRYDGNEFVNFTMADGLAGNGVYAIHSDSDGIVWFGTDGGVSRYDGNEFVSFTMEDGLISNSVLAIYCASDGVVWSGVQGGVSRYDGSQFVNFTIEEGLIHQSVHSIYGAPDGAMWFGTWDNGVSRYDGSEFVTFTTRDGLSDNDINRSHGVPGGVMWFGTQGGGIARYDGNELVSFTKEDGLAGNGIISIYHAPDDVVWIGTWSYGVSRYDGREFVNFTIEDGLASDSIWTIHSDTDGAVWLGGEGGASRYDGSEFVNFTMEDGLAGNDVRAIYCAPDGVIWFGTYSSGVSRYDENEFVSFSIEDGLASNTVNIIYGDPDGVIWFGTEDGGVSRYDSGRFVNFTTEDGLAHNSVVSIHRDPDGMMWFGIRGGGVSYYDGSAWGSLDTRDGLAGNTVGAILQDSDGALFFSTEGGITRYRPNNTSLKVSIVSVTTDQTYEDLSVIPAFTPGVRVTIEYKALDFRTLPEKQQYRYRIRELDSDWHRPTKSTLFDHVFRESGTYTFEVQAIGRDLNYSEPASVEIKVLPPPFYTRAGYIIGAILVAFLIPASAFATVVIRQRRQTFEPIQNPYIVGNPIRTRDMFFGRQDDFEFVRAKLATGQSGLVIVFAGERRSGKTSILFQILEGALGDQFVPVLLDMQAMAVDSDAQFLEQMASGIDEALVQAGCEAAESYSWESDPVRTFGRFISHAMEQLSDRSLLLMLDEYELIESKIDDSILRSDIITFFASLLEAHPRLSLIFTGSRHLEGRNAEYWSILIGKSLYRRISFLSESDALRLITEPVADRVVYPRGIPERIVRLTAGQPFYTQVVCQNMMDRLNEVERNRVRQEDVDAVAQELADNPLPQMIYFWDGLAQEQRSVLSVLGEVLANPNDYASAQTLADFAEVQNLSLEYSLPELERILNDLFISDILERERAGGGQYEYRFRADLFRLWVRQAHSVWE